MIADTLLDLQGLITLHTKLYVLSGWLPCFTESFRYYLFLFCFIIPLLEMKINVQFSITLMDMHGNIFPFETDFPLYSFSIRWKDKGKLSLLHNWNFLRNTHVQIYNYSN